MEVLWGGCKRQTSEDAAESPRSSSDEWILPSEVGTVSLAQQKKAGDEESQMSRTNSEVVAWHEHRQQWT